jgi:hypothetical protein
MGVGVQVPPPTPADETVRGEQIALKCFRTLGIKCDAIDEGLLDRHEVNREIAQRAQR